MVLSRDLLREWAQTVVRKEGAAMWTKPEATEMRFGFEVTMYVANR